MRGHDICHSPAVDILQGYRLSGEAVGAPKGINSHREEYWLANELLVLACEEELVCRMVSLPTKSLAGLAALAAPPTPAGFRKLIIGLKELVSGLAACVKNCWNVTREFEHRFALSSLPLGEDTRLELDHSPDMQAYVDGQQGEEGEVALRLFVFLLLNAKPDINDGYSTFGDGLRSACSHPNLSTDGRHGE